MSNSPPAKDRLEADAPPPPRNASREETDTAEYWDTIYRESEENRPGWDLGAPNPELVWQLENAVPELVPGRVLVPGCGYGHDLRLFAERGFEVTGVDLAPMAVAGARLLLEEAGVAGVVVEGDFFAIEPGEGADFDYIYEYTCFCAIHPTRRREYAEQAARLLRRGGQLIGCFYNHGNEGGPPFDTTAEAVRRAFEGLFEMRTLAFAQHSVDRRMGKELWARFVRV